MRYMLDTNICIYAIKNDPKSVLNNLEKHNPSDICISSITYAELMYGVEKSANKDKNRLALMLLLSNIEIMEFDQKASESYGTIRAFLESKGTVIGPYDMLIAGHALSLNCTFVTNNTKEFKRIKSLSIENWA